MNSSLKIVLIVVGLFLVLMLVGAIYHFFHYGILDISKKAPFVDVVGKELTLKRAAFLERMSANSHYFLTETKTDSANMYYTLPKGTKLRFKCAKVEKQPHRLGVPYVKGEIYLEALGQTVSFKYYWVSARFDASEPGTLRTYRKYALAPWQDLALEGEYPYHPMD